MKSAHSYRKQVVTVLCKLMICISVRAQEGGASVPSGNQRINLEGIDWLMPLCCLSLGLLVGWLAGRATRVRPTAHAAQGAAPAFCHQCGARMDA